MTRGEKGRRAAHTVERVWLHFKVLEPITVVRSDKLLDETGIMPQECLGFAVRHFAGPVVEQGPAQRKQKL
jgi:hypothetical protein